MIKSEFIEQVSNKMINTPKKTIVDGVNLILETMETALLSGQDIEVRNFGHFTLRTKRPTKRRNPKTGESVLTEGGIKMHFKPGKLLRDRLNNAQSVVAIQD